jgi:hypothetical protein
MDLFCQIRHILFVLFTAPVLKVPLKRLPAGAKSNLRPTRCCASIISALTGAFLTFIRSTPALNPYRRRHRPAVRVINARQVSASDVKPFLPGGQAVPGIRLHAVFSLPEFCCLSGDFLHLASRPLDISRDARLNLSEHFIC